MVDLIQAFNEGLNNIRTWRNRYTPSEYPAKVVLNIFYRKYTMYVMWDDMLPYINQCKGGDFSTAVQELERIYGNTAINKIQRVLLMKLQSQPDFQLGGTSYAAFSENIRKASVGDKTAKEEIEFAYLFNLLADKATLYWAAACSTGADKIKAVGIVSGYMIETMPINDYSTANMVLGRLSAAPYLHNHYKPLP